ncbi:MAG: acyl carrier protein [Alphaproteobacteria bacterium]|nr:acyl carrier protein [Alphaproteobacteria bacterium]
MDDLRMRARGLLADALELTPDELPDDASIDTFDAWTSLGHMRLILGIEASMATQLDAALVIGIASLDDIVSVLQNGSAQ